jgi:ABC-type oligopeptide transport system substrate-binding subunit
MQRNPKSRVALILPSLLVLIAILVVACGNTGNNSSNSGSKMASNDKQVFHYPIGPEDFATLDPALVQDTTASYAIQSIFTGLVQFKDDGTLVDQLAASHSVSADGLTYSFTLKPGLKFSNGDPLTANDIAWSIDRVLKPSTKSEVAGYMALLKDFEQVHSGKLASAIGDSIIVKDDMHIDFVLEKPAAYFLQTMTYPTWYPINQKLVTKYGDQWTDHLGEGAGNGPFKVSEYNHTKGLTLVPNSNYYGDQPKLQKVSMEISGDGATTYKAYLSKQYDTAGIPAANLDDAKKRSDYHTTAALVIRYLNINWLAKPFDDVNVRKAFALAINKDLIVSSVFKNAVTATNHYVPEGIPGYNKDLKGPDGTTSTAGNTTLAKQLLSQSSYGSADKLPSITFTYPTGSASIANAVTAIQQQWKSVLGVDVKLNGVAFTQLSKEEGQTKENARGLQIWLNGWQADYPDQQDWLSIFFSKGADYNNANYGQNTGANATQQQSVQDLLAKADVTSDQTQRAKTYNDAEQKISNDAGWIPLYQSKTNVLINPKLHGYEENPLGITAPDSWANIYFVE